ncbi:hypothetical protein [Photorhabdus heterorhabditis]|uniref:Lipoprotein n=1 Tax=Photorhabdus heterorhabditis TaxID=880156 RepID=A0A5B0X876_9GAMM|nr:hypothetical protein [Photorhabdus heterorhabditis]KAA1195526.1 hypothetical protein F0L16_02255 [Photorhabdus heterorhabditis]
MRFGLIISILLAIFITGCTTKISTENQTDTKFNQINSSAKDCVTELSKKITGNEGKHVFTFAFYVSSQSEPLGNSNYTKSVTTGIPYFTETTLDNGDPGSAWRNCMLKHNALVPQIKFPKT